MDTIQDHTLFFLLEADTIVRMDVQDTLSREFMNGEVRLCETQEELVRAVSETVWQCVVIVDADEVSLDGIAPTIIAHGKCALVALSETPESLSEDAFTVEAILRPFATPTLITAVRSALESLRSSL